MAATTLTDRAVVRLSGEDVQGFLQGLVTSDLAGALPVWAGLLTPQGKCLFDFFVWKDRDDLLLDCEAEAADDLIKRLSIYRLRRQIKIGRDATLASHWSKDTTSGIPDPRLQERACACVVLRPGVDEFTFAEMQQFLGDKGLARQYWPEGLEVLAELPSTASGKIQKYRLRQAITGAS